MKKLIWIPRIIVLLQILFFGVFSLNDDIHTVLILFIPVYILTIVLLISWKSPLITSILTFIVMIVFGVFFNTIDYYMKFLVITLPQFVAFILFTITAIFTFKGRKYKEEVDDGDSDEDNEVEFKEYSDDDYYRKFK